MDYQFSGPAEVIPEKPTVLTAVLKARKNSSAAARLDTQQDIFGLV
jgi:hypothetical protein